MSLEPILIAASLAFYAWLTFKKPLRGLGIILALLPTYLIRLRLFNFPTTYLELLLVVFLLVVFATHWQNYKLFKSLGRLNISIGLFILAGIISVFVSPEMIRGFGIFKAFVLEPVLFFYSLILVKSYSHEYDQQFLLPLKYLFGSASLFSFFGIIQYFTVLFLPLRFWGNGEEIRRITSVFEYPNALALYLAPLFVFFVILKFRKFEFVSRAWFDFGLLVQAIALLLTFSRGAWIAVGVILLMISIQQFSIKKLALFAAIIVVLAGFTPPLRSRITQTLHDPSGVARLDLMQAAVNKLKTAPIQGNGLYGFRTTLAEQNFNGEVLNYPHNIILNFWLEMGLLGLISFGLIVFTSAKQYWLSPTTLGLAALGFIGVILIHGAFDVPYVKNDLAILFWFVIGIFYSK